VYLAALGDFDLLRVLFETITIPRAVFEEVTVAGATFPVARAVLEARDKWILLVDVPDVAQTRAFEIIGLDPGESEALALALSTHPDAVLLDDQDAVHQAVSLGLNVIRTPGVYRLAKQRGLIGQVRPKLDALRGAGFWLRDEHYRIILERAGEL